MHACRWCERREGAWLFITVTSPSTTVIVFPPNNEPELEASSKANFAESLIAGVRDSIGPVKPRIIPTLISANAAVDIEDRLIKAARINFECIKFCSR